MGDATLSRTVDIVSRVSFKILTIVIKLYTLYLTTNYPLASLLNIERYRPIFLARRRSITGR